MCIQRGYSRFSTWTIFLLVTGGVGNLRVTGSIGVSSPIITGGLIATGSSVVIRGVASSFIVLPMKYRLIARCH
jgi:hypothetical protein